MNAIPYQLWRDKKPGPKTFLQHAYERRHILDSIINILTTHKTYKLWILKNHRPVGRAYTSKDGHIKIIWFGEEA